jgi:hypothetical protein
VVQRHYGESFFRAGTVDQFVAPSTAGTDLMLRYWGTFHPGGTAGCTPLESQSP